MIRILTFVCTLHLMFLWILETRGLQQGDNTWRTFDTLEWKPLPLHRSHLDTNRTSMARTVDNYSPWGRMSLPQTQKMQTRRHWNDAGGSASSQLEYQYKPSENSAENALTKFIRNRQVSTKKPCKGFDNILNDMGILSLVMSIIGSILGVTTDVFSVIGIGTSLLSVLFASGPSSLLVLIERFITTDIRFGVIGVIVEIAGVIDKFVNVYFNIPFSIVTTALSSLGDLVSLIGLAFGILALFPEEIEEGINELFGKDFVRNYGCGNPLI